MAWIERHWERVTPVSAALWPLSLAFRAAAALRRAAYRAGWAPVAHLPVPVIVVGNLTVGGTGKTPLVLWLARWLRERGFRPGIVSRGHGGANRGPVRVGAHSDPDEVGEEPVLLARRSGCEVWIGANRAAAAAALLEADPACDVVLCDDGLQHYGLARDVELCVVDAARGAGNGWLLPAGPLREPLSRLGTVDAVVLNGAGWAADTAPAAPRFAMRIEAREFRNLLDPERRAGPERFRGLRVHAVAGIGNPERFFRTLRELGIEFTPHPFPDHYRFRAADLAFAGAEAILMTEKDAVKCERFAGPAFWSLPVEAVPDERLGALVLKRLDALGKGRARGGGPGRRNGGH